MEVGGVIFMKEPHPFGNETQFDKLAQRFLRPKRTYIKILEDYACKKLKEYTHPYRRSAKDFGREFILVYRKLRDMNTTD